MIFKGASFATFFVFLFCIALLNLNLSLSFAQTAEVDSAHNAVIGNKSTLVLKANDNCFVVEFESKPGSILSCTELLPIQYTKRSCASEELKEAGDVEASVVCVDSHRYSIQFLTTTGVVSSTWSVNRKSLGRAGVAAQYIVEASTVEKSAMEKILPKPVIRELNEKSPDESPLKVDFSGYAWFEYENAKGYGYTAKTDFSSNATGENVSSLVSQFTMSAAKDRSIILGVLDLGEVYYGDAASGGGQATGSSDAIKVRNFYVGHQWSEELNFKFGLMTIAADTRSFIFNDHVAGALAEYNSDLLSGSVWYANALQDRPGALGRDEYFGFSGSMVHLTEIKHSVFGVVRWANNEHFFDATFNNVTGNSNYQWLGLHFDFDQVENFNFEANYIYNWSRFEADRASGGVSDNAQSYLIDAKMTYSKSPLMSLAFEALMTPGAANTMHDDGTDVLPRLGKRHSFSSPVGVSYLMSIATSDGVDDAPGAAKDSVIAGLGTEEGLNIAIVTMSSNFNKRTTAFLRYGYLNSVANSANNGNKMGEEVDIGMVYQITPSTLFQLDYGVFSPGDYFAESKTASLITSKIKVTL